MSRGLLDVIEVQAQGAAENATRFDFNWERWASCRIRNSIVGPAEASFELGDESGWLLLEDYCQLGAQFAIMVDDRPRFSGRVEALSSTSDATQSSTQSFVVRTKLSDAIYSSAPQNIRLKGASIKQFVLACYTGLKLTEADFDFRVDASRDLMTGKPSRGARPSPPLEPLTEEQLKIGPPETIFAAVDRHLRRHGLLHWDGPDGRIIVGKPDDTQEAIGVLRSLRSPYGQFNNVVSIERTLDVSQSPTVLGVFGAGGKQSFAKTKISSVLFNEDLIRRGFYRTIVIVDEALKTKGIAGARANREFAIRNRSLNRLNVTLDGLSYRDGAELLPWAPDTVVEVIADQMGGTLGNYFVEEVEMSRTASEGDRTRLTLVKQGVWVL